MKNENIKSDLKFTMKANLALLILVLFASLPSWGVVAYSYYYAIKYANMESTNIEVTNLLKDSNLNLLKVNHDIKNMDLVTIQGIVKNGIKDNHSLELVYDEGTIQVSIMGATSQDKLLQLVRNDTVTVKGELRSADIDKSGKARLFMYGIIE